jgi:hypothetical protein
MRVSPLSPQEKRRIAVFHAAIEIVGTLLTNDEIAAVAVKYMGREKYDACHISAWATRYPCPVNVFKNLHLILGEALNAKVAQIEVCRSKLFIGALEAADPISPFQKKSRRVE